MQPLDASRFLHCNPDGGRTPLVMVTTWWTDEERLRSLAGALGPDQPVVGVLPPPLVDGQLPTTVEDWVAHVSARLDELALDAPEGDGLRLLGYSFGGTVALEAARARADGGRPVAWLGMIDTMRPRRNPKGAGPWLRFHLSEALAMDDPELRREYLWSRARGGWMRTYGKLGRAARPTMQRLGLRSEPFPLHPLETGEGMVADARAITISYLKYEATPYDRPVALFSTAATTRRSGDDPSLRWAAYLRGGFTVAAIDGGHFTIFDPEHVASVAGALRTSLDAAQ